MIGFNFVSMKFPAEVAGQLSVPDGQYVDFGSCCLLEASQQFVMGVWKTYVGSVDCKLATSMLSCYQAG